jgi:hypothetical protein
MNEVHARWERVRDQLNAELGGLQEAICRVPGWEPDSLEVGLRWLQSSIYQGFYTDFRIERQGTSATVWFKIWEYGEPEPDWASVMSQGD